MAAWRPQKRIAAERSSDRAASAGAQSGPSRQGGAATAVTIKGSVRLTAAEGVREAVFDGLGLAVTSEWMFAPEIASGRVRRVLQDGNFRRSIFGPCFVRPQRQHQGARVRELIEQGLGAAFEAVDGEVDSATD
jgi:DNA-binding transcriptional LysR family regulator